MKTTTKLLLIAVGLGLLSAMSCTPVSAQTTLPVHSKFMTKISVYKGARIVDMYFAFKEQVGADVIVKKYNGRYYSNFPYKVKMDTVNKMYRIYKHNKLVFLYINGNFEPVTLKSI